MKRCSGRPWESRYSSRSVGKRACMARLLFSETGGLLERLDEACLAELNREDIQWQLDYAPGEKLPAAKNGTDRIGHLIMRTRR